MDEWMNGRMVRVREPGSLTIAFIPTFRFVAIESPVAVFCDAINSPPSEVFDQQSRRGGLLERYHWVLLPSSSGFRHLNV